METELFWWMLLFLTVKILLQNINGELKTASDETDYVSSFNFTQSLAYHGYRSEEHTVVTEDGYILTLFRIPKGKNCYKTNRQPPVLLMHGLLVSSDSWIDAGPTAGLAYLIADECYDLWLGNVRGNHYSKKHLRFDPHEDPEYWNFTPDEVGIYDSPAIIDYVLRNTKSATLNYIGYSQSGATFLIMCSEMPGYCDKIRHAILLHPASRMNSTKSIFFRLITNTYESIEPYLCRASDFEALPQGGLLQNFTAWMCKNDQIANTLCRWILYAIDSPHPGAIDEAKIRTIANHLPAGTSVKSMVWYKQRLNKDVFVKYDYGTKKNLQLYGMDKAPAYNITAVNVPVLLIHGKNDYLASPYDVEWLRDELPNALELYYVKDPLWNHFDVLYNQHSRWKMFPKIREYLFKYSQ